MPGCKAGQGLVCLETEEIQEVGVCRAEVAVRRVRRYESGGEASQIICVLGQAREFGLYSKLVEKPRKSYRGAGFTFLEAPSRE